MDVLDRARSMATDGARILDQHLRDERGRRIDWRRNAAGLVRFDDETCQPLTLVVDSRIAHALHTLGISMGQARDGLLIANALIDIDAANRAWREILAQAPQQT